METILRLGLQRVQVFFGNGPFGIVFLHYQSNLREEKRPPSGRHRTRPASSTAAIASHCTQLSSCWAYRDTESTSIELLEAGKRENWVRSDMSIAEDGGMLGGMASKGIREIEGFASPRRTDDHPEPDAGL